MGFTDCQCEVVLVNNARWLHKSETRMTASIVKQDPNTQKIQNNTIYLGKTQHVNFRGNPLYHADILPST